MYRLDSGVLEHVFEGDEPGRHTGELLGHTGVVTALFFYKYTVYSGSMDCTVQVSSRREAEVHMRRQQTLLRGLSRRNK